MSQPPLHFGSVALRRSRPLWRWQRRTGRLQKTLCEFSRRAQIRFSHSRRAFRHLQFRYQQVTQCDVSDDRKKVFSGITCLIFGVIVLLYRINVNNQNRRRYQNHLETINAILGNAKYYNWEYLTFGAFRRRQSEGRRGGRRNYHS